MSLTTDLVRRRKKSAMVECEYGTITYREWCLKEVKRVGRKCTFHEDDDTCWIQKGEAYDKKA